MSALEQKWRGLANDAEGVAANAAKCAEALVKAADATEAATRHAQEAEEARDEAYAVVAKHGQQIGIEVPV